MLHEISVDCISLFGLCIDPSLPPQNHSMSFVVMQNGDGQTPKHTEEPDFYFEDGL